VNVALGGFGEELGWFCTVADLSKIPTISPRSAAVPAPLSAPFFLHVRQGVRIRRATQRHRVRQFHPPAGQDRVQRCQCAPQQLTRAERTYVQQLYVEAFEQLENLRRPSPPLCSSTPATIATTFQCCRESIRPSDHSRHAHASEF
jgi:hypothetical protein